MKIATIIGARPQFIKCAPVSREIRKENKEILIHTGQHYDYGMSGAFFEELSIPKPDYNLSIGSGSHAEQTGRMLIAIEEILTKEVPDLVLVYGDTNSTLAGALAASKLNISVAHIEAGLRSFDRSMPEEVNRVMTDHISDLLFCPTQTAVDNLLREGITRGVYLVGDVMVDSLLCNRELAHKSDILIRLGVSEGGYYLATVHRAGNLNDKQNLESIMAALSSLNKPVIFPLHPGTRKYLNHYGISAGENIQIIEPLPYLDMLSILSHAAAVLTDSGGVQKEAYILKIPCITLRKNTEWVETVEDGWNVLAGVDSDTILAAVRTVTDCRGRRHEERFGDGKAAEKIVGIINHEYRDMISSKKFYQLSSLEEPDEPDA